MDLLAIWQINRFSPTGAQPAVPTLSSSPPKPQCYHHPHPYDSPSGAPDSKMTSHRLRAGWFMFKRVFWPTFDAYSDIMLAIYCVYHGVIEWGLIITLPMFSNFATSLSAYLRLRKTLETQDPRIWSAEGFALPLLIWPQVCATLLN